MMERMTCTRSKIKTGAFAAWMLGALACMSPASVQAAEGLDMSTDYPGITAQAGDSVSFGLDFASLTGDGYDAALSVASIPEGWEGYFRGTDSQISKVHVDNASQNLETSLATFYLTLPEDAQAGTYTVQLKADAGGGNQDVLDLEVTVSEEETGQGSFSSEYPQQQGAAVTSFSFDTTIINNGGTDQSYSLSAEAPSGWQVNFTPSGESSQVASMTVEAGTSKGLTVGVTPPEGVEKGEYTISCTAVSGSETLTTDLQVEITGTYEVEVTTPSGNLSLDAYANDEESITLSIKNNGNVDLTNLNLTSSAPTDWEVRFEESTIDTLEAGGTKEITAYVTPDADAMTGDYVTTITVSNDQVSSEAQFRVSVKTRTGWGIFAIALILVILAGMWYVFRKYGRR